MLSCCRGFTDYHNGVEKSDGQPSARGLSCRYTRRLFRLRDVRHLHAALYPEPGHVHGGGGVRLRDPGSGQRVVAAASRAALRSGGGPEYPRSGQIELMQSIEQFIEEKYPMLIQTPNVLRKTVGVLYPI